MLPGLHQRSAPALSLREKLERSWAGEDVAPEVTKMADIAGATYFWFICITELYVVLVHTIPYNYSGYTDMGRYWLRVWGAFVFIQATANWLCVRCYAGRNAYRVTADRPDLAKQLWDEHPEDGEAVSGGKTSPRPEQHANGHPPTNTNGYVSLDLTGDHVAAEDGYLGWRRCGHCQQDAPPRSHHCKICRVCVLKRDHHCYMTGVCVGHYNQRYFVVLNFYTIIASCYGLYELYHYLGGNFWADFRDYDYLLPVTLYRWAFRDVPLHIALMMIQLYTFWWTGAMACGFFCMQLMSIFLGLTSHEFQKLEQCHVRCVGTRAENFREVFGVFWLVNLLMPGQLLFRQKLDGTEWPNLKLVMRRKGKVERLGAAAAAASKYSSKQHD